MAQTAKLWGTGGGLTEDVTQADCRILTNYPTILYPSTGHLIRSATVAPAPINAVTLTATATDDTHITFQSAGVNLLGTKILSFFIYTNKVTFTRYDSKQIVYLCGAATTNTALVSSAYPSKLTNADAGEYLSVHGFFSNSTTTQPSKTAYGSYSNFDKVALSYTGADGDLTVTINYATGSGAYAVGGKLITDYTYTGIFRIVDEA